MIEGDLDRSLHDYEFGACKVITKEGLSDQYLEYIQNEIINQDLVENRFVVRLRKAIETPDKFYCFLEYCNGGDLKELMDAKNWKVPQVSI